MTRDKITIDYYENNAESFTQGTLDVDFTDVQDWFLDYIPECGRILDFGCGSGRDTAYFLKKGYMVDAIDGSEKLCKIASDNTGIDVKHMLFQELDAFDEYDGIWACASIIHLPKETLKIVFKKMICAIKPAGHIYVSFKYGDFEGYRNDRYFADFEEESFASFVNAFPEVSIMAEKVTADVRPGRQNEKWLNVILKIVE